MLLIYQIHPSQLQFQIGLRSGRIAFRFSLVDCLVFSLGSPNRISFDYPNAVSPLEDHTNVIPIALAGTPCKAKF